MKTSVFVVSYNRENLIEACVAGLGFADEVILVDKSSTDSTRERAAKWVDRIVTVPWSAFPGETFAHALSLCSHEWVVALSDDECLNVAAIDFIKQEVQNPRADVYYLPRQNFILGRFDERAWYWPDWCPQFYRRESFEYRKTIHGAAQSLTQNQYRVPLESGVAIVHLSHESADQWIEKTNRYTSQADRKRLYLDANVGLAELSEPGGDLRAFAQRAIDFWLSGATGGTDEYPARVNLLRAIYDMVDHIKTLEERDHIDGHELFAMKCRELMNDYDAYYQTDRRGRRQPTPTALSSVD